ncbi:hypothetical protein BDC45DRAFT_563577 [Circinella umbellata]|nr:hypothetical protein BDC45DRAFT_563577 [Circinella umbellata]
MVTDSAVLIDRDIVTPSSSPTSLLLQTDKKGKKRMSSQRDKIDDLFNPQKRPSTTTTRTLSEFLADQQDDGNAIHEEVYINHIVIMKDNRIHRTNCPGNMPISPHQPKVEPATIKGISKYVVMAVTGLVKYHWCEKQLLANKLAYLKLGSRSSNKNGQRLMDGLASICGTPSKLESVLMEVASGNPCYFHTTKKLNPKKGNSNITTQTCKSHS